MANPKLSLIDITSQYGVLKMLAGHLWPQDVINIALTDRAHHEYIAGDKTRLSALLNACLHCDGSSGRLWQQLWLNHEASNHRTRTDNALPPPIFGCRGEGPDFTTQQCTACKQPLCNVSSSVPSYQALLILLHARLVESGVRPNPPDLTRTGPTT